MEPISLANNQQKQEKTWVQALHHFIESLSKCC